MKSSLELAGGIILVIVGILFLLGFGLDLQDLITDAIFIGFGVLLIRGARQKSRVSQNSTPQVKKNRNGSQGRKKNKNTV